MTFRKTGVVCGFMFFFAMSMILPENLLGKGDGLPDGLFVSKAPVNAVEVATARKNAEQGKPIAIRGRIGGLVAPFAEKYAIFVLSDLTLPPCTDGCPTAWDYCCTPREQILANIATIQVVDGQGKPLKTSMKGTNGLQPMSEVIVRGTVAKRDDKMLVINAENIFIPGVSKEK
jgi:hypothetical protein